MKQIKERYKKLSFEINERIKVANVMQYDSKNDYVKTIKAMMIEKSKIKVDIEKYYQDIRANRIGAYETITEFFERMDTILEKDNQGNILHNYYKLGIDALDNEFFNGKGVYSNSLISIGADSAVGKTTLALQIVSSLAKQEVKTQFFSFEMGEIQFFNEIDPQAKNKLKAIINSEYKDNITLDFSSRQVNDLATAIQLRAEDGVGAFVIDSYLSIYAGDNEYQKMTELTDMLATMKKELGVLIIIIAQISKSDSKDNIYDFHGGNKLKYESDVALFIKLLDGEEDTTKRLMWCEKNRIFEENQRIGMVTEYNRESHKIEKISDLKTYTNNPEIKKSEKWANRLKAK